MGSGGSRGLQNRCLGTEVSRGWFDSDTPPPLDAACGRAVADVGVAADGLRPQLNAGGAAAQPRRCASAAAAATGAAAREGRLRAPPVVRRSACGRSSRHAMLPLTAQSNRSSRTCPSGRCIHDRAAFCALQSCRRERCSARNATARRSSANARSAACRRRDTRRGVSTARRWTGRENRARSAARRCRKARFVAIRATRSRTGGASCRPVRSPWRCWCHWCLRRSFLRSTTISRIAPRPMSA
jgi:hypothetical protein